MGIVTTTDEFTSPISAPRLFKALVLDGDKLLPKIAPQAIKNVEIIQGDGGPGTIKQLNFVEGTPVKFLKRRVDALDKENMTYAYSLIESDHAFMDKIVSISSEIKVESRPDGGCKIKKSNKYHTKPGHEIKEEEIKVGVDKADNFLKACETYLLANPNEYA